MVVSPKVIPIGVIDRSPSFSDDHGATTATTTVGAEQNVNRRARHLTRSVAKAARMPPT